MDMCNVLKSHLEIINYYINQVNQNNYEEILSSLYNCLKRISNIYYIGYGMHDAYRYLIRPIIKLEEKFSEEKILNIPIDSLKFKSNGNLIDYIIDSDRSLLKLRHIAQYGLNKKIEDINLTNDCMKSSEYINWLCKENGVECYSLEIYPGYCPTAFLYNGGGYHIANIINYNNKYYLVDVTYSQFFYSVYNNLDRIGVVNIPNCNLGSFMLMTEKGKNIATNILKYGYIELTEEVLKIYLDAFTLSFRNGLFYENTKDFSFTTPYSVDDYIKFLNGYDNQIKHEGEENLGYQTKPLKNWQLSLKNI